MPQSALNPRLAETLRRVTVVPVLTVARATDAAPLAGALAAGGLSILEVTLRTPVAIAAIAAMRAAVPGGLVGAGTVLTPEQGEAAIAAGAGFLVSPGISPRLAAAAERWSVPLLPGVATPSEAMALHDLGYRALKLFPAEPLGGAATLRAWAAPLADLAFCPTGGIDAAKAAAYLRLSNVLCVGGSWVAPADLVAAGDWAGIAALARAAAAMPRA
jgi:2-dehydro-3-deoxyphosphogluconate aldolase/(4S)-4-hydroxy-2-oxoglutarate aldolase